MTFWWEELKIGSIEMRHIFGAICCSVSGGLVDSIFEGVKGAGGMDCGHFVVKAAIDAVVIWGQRQIFGVPLLLEIEGRREIMGLWFAMVQVDC